MPGFATCTACHGFVADLHLPCVHCGAPPPRRRALARFLATAVFGVTSAVTLMACYGATYDCYDTNCGSTCTSDYDCYSGSACIVQPDGLGACIYTGTCYRDADCPDDMHCDESRTTCTPGAVGCDSNDDCQSGYERCDVPTGTCVEAIPCGYDGSLCGEGARCDPSWWVCVPCAGAECGSCSGDITCGFSPPACPTGTQPGIETGCYNGSCIADATCTAELCAPLDEPTCAATDGCEPSYVGINCTNPDGGGPCTPEACVCESYEFGECVVAPPDPPPPA